MASNLQWTWKLQRAGAEPCRVELYQYQSVEFAEPMLMHSDFRPSSHHDAPHNAEEDSNKVQVFGACGSL